MERAIVIGGGVIGLSLAYELAAGGGFQVVVLERGEPGREASWAGAGILTPAGDAAAAPVDRLRALSLRLIAEWSERLRAETGIDNGFLRCGALQVATGDQEAAALDAEAERWRADGIAVETPTAGEVRRLEPRLAPDLARVYRLPEGAQLRNPWHLRALAAACVRRGVELATGTPALGFEGRGGRVERVSTPSGPVAGDRFVLAAGPWSPALAADAGVELPGTPVRGQIVLLESAAPLVSHVVWSRSRYLVPRPEGPLLIGSTEEDAGFDARPTAAGVADLLALARRLVPAAGGAAFARAWAGLRPGSPDAVPVLGPAPGWDNLYLATGHFRSGFELSAGSARLLGRLLRGEQPELPLAPFAVERFAAPEAEGPAGGGASRSPTAAAPGGRAGGASSPARRPLRVETP